MSHTHRLPWHSSFPLCGSCCVCLNPRGFLQLSADIAAIGKFGWHLRLLPQKEKGKQKKSILSTCPPPGPTRDQVHMHVAHLCCLQHPHLSFCQGYEAMAGQACKMTRTQPMFEVFPYGMKCMRCGPLTDVAFMSFLSILSTSTAIS